MSKSKHTPFLIALILLLTLLLLPHSNTPTAAQTTTNLIPFVYQNNIWLADPDALTLQQITTDATPETIYTNPTLSPSGRYLAFEKRTAPFEYYQGATAYNIYDLHTNTLAHHGSFPTQYSFPDLYGEQKTESHTILGWQHDTETLLVAREINNCNQDPQAPRTLEILTFPPPYEALTLQTTQISNAPAIEALSLTNSPQNWINFRDNCCACGPSITHLNYLSPTGQSLTFEGSHLQTTAIIPSPDNNHVAYASSPGYDVYYYEDLTELGTSTLHLANLDLTDPVTLHTLPNYHIEDHSIQWSPSNQHLAFITFNIHQNSDQIEKQAAVIPTTSTNPIILNTPSVQSLRWSPNGIHLLILTQNEGILLYDTNRQISHTFQTFGNPINLDNSVACAHLVPTRLLSSSRAQVLAEPPIANNLRAQPNTNAQLVGQIAPGGTFTLLDGPICNQNFRYWYVQDDATNLIGWTAENNITDYFVHPIE